MIIYIVVGGLLTASLLSLLFKNRVVGAAASIIAHGLGLIGAVALCLRVASDGDYIPSLFTLVDPLSALTVLIISIVGLAASVYAAPYLDREVSKGIIGPKRFRQYFGLVNLFMACMLLSVTAAHPIAAWIFLEATTLSTAFLISFYDRPSTIEAAWKYLIINSTGLLLGFFGALLFFSATSRSGLDGFVTWQSLLQQAQSIDPGVVKVAFVFVLVGFGTKVGLAPMHAWKPDAYSKSPAPVGALLSGALLPVALVTILKFKVITDTAVGGAFSSHLLMVLGVLSLLIAAFSILTIRNYKRMMGYSSIEHAGLMALGFAFGGLGAFAAILHLIYHSLIKAGLFFTAGNLRLSFHSAKIKNVSGALKVVPVTAGLFMLLFLAATGLPPFGIFMSELYIFGAGLKQYPIVTIVALLAVALVFVGFFRQVSAVLFGDPPEGAQDAKSNKWLLIPPIVLLSLVLVFSFYLPPPLLDLINEAVRRYDL
ncbi:proton-conducting transporter membrane subunit [Cryobacterium sp. Y50]|uniref:proton-conducting transporter transmembrane domain-containing protein n=1 Tax=Cryobacterium sp. Y50 TaxID=2048286 RepID=UPI000CE3F208|nr:proton-conducting transporter membrane subunit [Cryobacterium sp. Y50]